MKALRKIHPSLYKNLIGIAVAFCVSIFILLFYLPGLFTAFENKTGDIRFRRSQSSLVNPSRLTGNSPLSRQ